MFFFFPAPLVLLFVSSSSVVTFTSTCIAHSSAGFKVVLELEFWASPSSVSSPRCMDLSLIEGVEAGLKLLELFSSGGGVLCVPTSLVLVPICFSSCGGNLGFKSCCLMTAAVIEAAETAGLLLFMVVFGGGG
uniref:Secreted protein n=1 Tax=Opuntia streptacantha TaxID=393608 RepID=A0A7C8ZGE9_OPUST